jgi:hypothetical protein
MAVYALGALLDSTGPEDCQLWKLGSLTIMLSLSGIAGCLCLYQQRYYRHIVIVLWDDVQANKRGNWAKTHERRRVSPGLGHRSDTHFEQSLSGRLG